MFDRKEVEASVSFDAATPKRAELKQAISGKIAANPEFMVLRKVRPSFRARNPSRYSPTCTPARKSLMSASSRSTSRSEKG